MNKLLKATGIIVEYNPFHNGHIHHIKKAKEITKCDVLIAVMSPNFVQRGEPSYIDKWTKTKYALEYGVDIVIELPTHIALQAAGVFAKGAITILDMMKVNYLVFGSESNNLELIKSLTFDKDKLAKGYGYAASFTQDFKPNDILGYEYLQAIKNTNIEPFTIQRTNNYNDLNITTNTIASASSIRLAHKNNQPYTHTTPIDLNKYTTHTLKEYESLIKYSLISKPIESYKDILLVDEGIENLLYKHALKPLNELLDLTTSKRYTLSRIRRTLMHILLNNPKNIPDIENCRILGFNKRGQQYLNQYKTLYEDIPFTTQFKTYQFKDLEYKATQIYSLPKSTDYQKKILEKEVQGPIIIQ